MSAMASTSNLTVAARTSTKLARPSRCLWRPFSSGLSARSEQPEQRHPRRTSRRKDSRIDSLVSLYQDSTSYPPISNPELFDAYLQYILVKTTNNVKPMTSAELDKVHKNKTRVVLEDRYDRDMPLGRHARQQPSQTAGQPSAPRSREMRVLDVLHGTYNGSQLGKDLVEETYEANELASGRVKEPLLEESSAQQQDESQLQAP